MSFILLPLFVFIEIEKDGGSEFRNSGESPYNSNAHRKPKKKQCHNLRKQNTDVIPLVIETTGLRQGRRQIPQEDSKEDARFQMGNQRRKQFRKRPNSP
jgi:hypothetical protein